MMLPTTLFEILEHVEEHRQTPIIGTFIRLIRFSAVFLSIYLVPLWMLIKNQGSISLKHSFYYFGRTGCRTFKNCDYSYA